MYLSSLLFYFFSKIWFHSGLYNYSRLSISILEAEDPDNTKVREQLQLVRELREKISEMEVAANDDHEATVTVDDKVKTFQQILKIIKNFNFYILITDI